MKEQYISFETAKLAKEKGYRIYCGISYWEKDGELFGTPYYEFPHDEERYNCYPRYFAPSQSLLQKWLRERHKLSIEVYYFKGWDYDICFMETNTNTSGKVDLGFYEEALEHGLLEALKLI